VLVDFLDWGLWIVGWVGGTGRYWYILLEGFLDNRANWGPRTVFECLS